MGEDLAEERPAPAPAARNLPAPYQDPWTLLWRDLRAVLASMRLRLWELSRRNRQGDLPLPPFWPRRLGSWFWPLVLALAATAATALLMLGLGALRGAAVRSPSPAPPTSLSEPGEQQAMQTKETPASPLIPGREAGAGPPQPPDPAEPAPVAAPAEPVVPPADPLLALLQPADPRQLVRAVHERPALACLQLELAAGFQDLTPAERQRQAETWRLRALELGYERLELLDGSGRLLGRTARVGSGMILLDAPGGADVA